MRRFVLIAFMLVMVVGLVGCGSSDAASTADTTGLPARADGVVRVVLGWDEAVDMDLEIWDADGMNAVTGAGLETVDVMDGTEGSEYFDFTGEFASGTYVVSIYFAEESNGISSSQATVTIYDANGDSVSRQKVIQWEPGMDQWHAFSVNGATGAITDIDQFVETTTE